MIKIDVYFHKRTKLVPYSCKMILEEDGIVFSNWTVLFGEREIGKIRYEEIDRIEIDKISNKFSVILHNGETFPSGNQYWNWITMNCKYLKFLNDYVSAKQKADNDMIDYLDDVAIKNEFDVYFLGDEEKNDEIRKKKTKKTGMICAIVIASILFVTYLMVFLFLKK